jgi:flavin-dependent dehydrogenase
MATELHFDVAIIGGGPAGSTVGTLLRKYNPSLSVAIFERERFPRDHVGESHLPAISNVLSEMGVWEKVEAADFPVKIGGTYRWGATDELWDLDFLHGHEFENLPRPNKFEGQRLQTAFQVDRSVYDTILLDHASELGCQVYQGVAVSKVLTDGDRVLSLELKGDTTPADSITAKYFVDCSGDSGILRRSMDVSCTHPTKLRNIGIWDYWNNAKWAVTLGSGGTRIQVLSLKWGWLWFIPISPTRTSIGLIVPADYYKSSGKSTEELYVRAIQEEPLVSQLIKEASREGQLQTTRDWSFIADRLYGENWFLAGDSAGFADPILSAGMTLAHTGARKVAYAILESERNELDQAWIKSEYDREHRNQIDQHIRFADFWYSSNGRFTDLKDYCSQLAKDAGLDLDADEAFRWLATGGFAVQEPGLARALGFRVVGLKEVTKHIAGQDPSWAITKTNVWIPQLRDAKEERLPLYEAGRIRTVASYRKGSKVLPLIGTFRHAMDAVKTHSYSKVAFSNCVDRLIDREGLSNQDAIVLAVEAFEALLAEGWIKGKIAADQPFLSID